MRKTREILRLKFELKLSNRLISLSCKVSSSTVWDCLTRFKASGLVWPLPEELADDELDRKMYSHRQKPRPGECPATDWQKIEREMRKKHVTLMLLWQEYKAAYPDGYQYSWFCTQYDAHKKNRDVVMRQEHKLGEKCFVDYAGDKIDIVDAETGEVRPANLFVGVLGASNYMYAEASFAQDLPSWISAHVRMFEFFGGVPEVLVPDNLKSGVTHACFYEPDINPSYQEMATHYGVVVLPTRVRRPRDKAKVENSVLIAERWILAGLRHRTFSSLAELNQAIGEKVAMVNGRPFQKQSGSRQSLFDSEEKPTLKPLPTHRYQYANRKKAKVHIDYHVELEGHYYSVHYTLARQEVEIRWTQNTVEIFQHSQRVASHLRSLVKGKATTAKEHMPPQHGFKASWTPERIVAWASKIGPHTSQFVAEIMNRRVHPEQGFRSSLGIMHLADAYGTDRLEMACHKATLTGGFSYKHVKSILKRKLETQSPLPAQTTIVFEDHENIRGPEYFHSGDNLC